MRRILGLVCAVVLIAGISGFAAAADLSYGVKGGINMANLTGDGISDTSSAMRFALGGFLTYSVSDNFVLQPELLYTQKGCEFDSFGITSKLKFDYIEIPILAKYLISPGKSTCPFIFGGPVIATLMSAKFDDEDAKDNIKSTDFGLVIGAGVELESGISIDIRYNMGLTKIAKDGGDIKNTVISLMVGYKL